jgi:hypothetical protein
MNYANYSTAIVQLRGGINENVSSLELEAGELLDCVNYMIAEGGYGGYISVKGYERFDGVTTPSQVQSRVMFIENAYLAPQDGWSLYGETSGSTADVVGDAVLISGDPLLMTAVWQVETVPTTSLVADVFIKGENISHAPEGTLGQFQKGYDITGGTVDYHQVIDAYTDTVEPVPGEGKILGVHIFEGEVYAFRKKVGIDEIGMYKEYEFAPGWIEIDTSANVLLYNSSHDYNMIFTNYNFYASSASQSMYWCDGYNRARAYDGTAVTVIANTGMGAGDGSGDAPINIIGHRDYLFQAYAGGSLQHSVLGDPTDWTGATGAGEIGLGDEITDIEIGVENTLVIYLREGIQVLTGSTIDDFSLVRYSRTSGAFKGTVQRLLGTLYSIDKRGVTSFEAVQEYGDYSANSISQRFKNTLFNRRHNITATTVNRDLNQYRIYYDDGSGIYVSFTGNEFAGETFIQFPHTVNCIAEGIDSDKRELIVFGADDEDGYVYKMDSGYSFDGKEIFTRLGTSYYHYGSPRRYKAFTKATVEFYGEDNQEFNLKVDFNYNEKGVVRTIWHTPVIYRKDGTAVYAEGEWGTMVYGGATATDRVPIYIQGIGTNLAYKIITKESYRPQHIIQNIITDFKLIGRRI